MVEVLELEQPLPQGWIRAKSRSGKEYFAHSETHATQWEAPPAPLAGLWEAPSAGCTTLPCLARRDATGRHANLLWLKQRVLAEVGALVDQEIMADLGCGAGEAVAQLASAMREYHGWDISNDALPLAKARIPAAHLSLQNFCAAGEVLPAGAPASRCSLVTCLDAAQYAFVCAASARRWARRVRALLCPTGIALLLLPSAADIVDKTANSCIEHVCRGREILRGCGASWPPTVLDVPIYGARYTLQPAQNAKGSLPQLGAEKPQWLVTRPTLRHACATAGLRVDAFCSASTFLRWCGMGCVVHDAEGQARRARTYAALEVLQSQFGALSAASWEELQLWSVAILAPEESAAGRWDFLKEIMVF
jgi:hypothetical protein